MIFRKLWDIFPSKTANKLRHIKNKYVKKIKSEFLSWKLTLSYYIFNKVPYPTGVIIDPINICNLKCPLCPTGAKKSNYKPTVMSFETFKTVIDKIHSLKSIALFNWGEPFLNKDIFKMIEYAKKKHISVTIHTNFSFKKDDKFFEDIVNSDLDLLTLSIDGTNPETYSKYRVGGDYNLVISNIKKLVETKKRLNKDKPDIMWKMVVNKFNEKEIEKARQISKGLGIKFATAAMNLADVYPNVDFGDINKNKDYWLPKNEKYLRHYYRMGYKFPLNDSICTRPFTTIIINPDGKVAPCCWTVNEEDIVGDLTKESFKEIWNNDKYRFTRSLFSKKRYNGPKTGSVCERCHNYRKFDKKKDSFKIKIKSSY